MLRTSDLVLSPPPAGAPYAVEARRGRVAFDALAEAWDALVARGPVDVPMVRHAWLAAWLDAFAPAAEPLVLVARGPTGEPAGMAVFLATRRRGLTWLRAPANDHSCRVEWALGADASGAVGALWRHLRDRVGWDVLLLRDLPRD